MATYNTPLITTQGLSLLKAEIAGNDSVTFTKIVFSSDDYSQTADSSVQALTALSSLDLTAPAKSFTDVNGNLKIRAVANNQNTTSAFYIKTYGLYGKNKAGNEILIAVSTAQNANFVPAYNGKQTNQIAYTFNIAVSSTNNITLSSSTDVDVTQADLASINNAVDSNASSLTAQQSSYAGSVTSAISSNANNITTNSNNISSLQSSVASNSSAVSNLQSSVAANSLSINSAYSDIAQNSYQINQANNSISEALTTANQALSTSNSGLQFKGQVPTPSLYQCQTSGIYDLGGVKYGDWGSQLWGQFIVVATGGVVNQMIKNNTGNCWVQTCNNWGNTGFKSIY